MYLDKPTPLLEKKAVVDVVPDFIPCLFKAEIVDTAKEISQA